MAIKEHWYIVLSNRTMGVSHKNAEVTKEYAYSDKELLELINSYEPGTVIEILKDETFYAVTHDDLPDWDWGSYDWEEAVRMAKECMEDGCANVQIAAIDKPATDAFCLETYHIEDCLD